MCKGRDVLSLLVLMVDRLTTSMNRCRDPIRIRQRDSSYDGKSASADLVKAMCTIHSIHGIETDASARRGSSDSSARRGLGPKRPSHVAERPHVAVLVPIPEG